MTAFRELYHDAVTATKRTKIIYIYDALLDPKRYSSSIDAKTSHENEARNNYMTMEFQKMLGVSSDLIVGVMLGALPDGGAATLMQDMDAACIYLEQGNTYYLLYQVRRTKLDETIAQVIGREGGLLVGASAGSIVAGKTIKTCEWKNWDDPGHGTWWDVRALPTGLDGLDLMDGSVGRSVFPHHSGQWNRRVEEMMPKHPEGVIVLDEEQFYVQGGGTTDEERVGRVRRQ